MTGILCSLSIIGAPTATSPVGALSVSLNRTSVSGSASSSSITTNSVSATGASGSSPYTYECSRVSGDSAISATSPSGRTTSFTRTSCVAGTSYSAAWRFKVTDNADDIVYSDNVSITITCTASSGGSGGGGGITDGGTFNGIADTSVNAGGIGATKTATFSINGDGTYNGGTWNSSSTVGSSYEVKATMISGSATTGTIGSWLSLSSNRSWSITDADDSDGAGVSCSFTLQIRQSGTTTVLDSATISLSAHALSL